MPKEYIERSELIRKLRGEYVGKYPASFYFGLFAASDEVEKMPAADVVEVVRCKDCKHWQYIIGEKTEYYECRIFCGAYERGYTTVANDFCSYGERKDEGK